MSCLRQSLGDKSNTYATALLAYVFTLAGDMETRTLLLEHLDKVATQEGQRFIAPLKQLEHLAYEVILHVYRTDELG